MDYYIRRLESQLLPGDHAHELLMRTAIEGIGICTGCIA